jgi:hypothetical protein
MPVRTLYAAAALVLLSPGAALCSADPQPALGAPETPAPAASAPTVAPGETAPRPASPAPAAGNAGIELPTFRSGLWEYRRTFVRPDTGRPQVATTRKCVDPAVEMREKMEALRKKGCQFAPLKRYGDRYVSSWVCQTPTGAMRFRDVLLAKDADSYEDVSETHTRERRMQQRIEATRRGECPGTRSGGAPTRPPKPPRRS